MSDFIMKIGQKEYNYSDLVKQLGTPKFNKYSIEELQTFSNVKLRQIIREEREIEKIPTPWRRDEYLLAVLFAHQGRCNHIRIEKETKLFNGFCSSKGTDNGRCRMKNKGGIPPEKAIGNDNALKHGYYSDYKSKISEEELEIGKELEQKTPAELLYERILFMERRLRFMERVLGIEGINESENDSFFEKIETTEQLDDNTVKYVARTQSKKKKTITMEDYLNAQALYIKMQEAYEKVREEEEEEQVNEIQININGVDMSKFNTVVKRGDVLSDSEIEDDMDE